MATMRSAHQSSFSRNQKATVSILPLVSSLVQEALPLFLRNSRSRQLIVSSAFRLRLLFSIIESFIMLFVLYMGYRDTWGRFLLGSVVIVLEDADAPHHLLLLRNFMAQGVVHRQPLLFASPADEPRGFLGTLPAPVVDSKDERRRDAGRDRAEHGQGLRIAWQYKKYFGEEQGPEDRNRDVEQEFSSNFDLRIF
ncbi:hypothetical protein HPP92_008022 [Vanilla planifolia]|uniref:Elongator complex protein 4 n=1 Tax=Vanilla planifolia TaxID=51239 RepID=A0A835RHK8_VANPL|nr:hypothetical protein HPP92_008022 [Vanilla planifolia]